MLFLMDTTKVIAEIDQELSRLQHARAIVAGLGGTAAPRKPGRPPLKLTGTIPAKASKKRGGISPEGRKRIAEAMKRRWAERRAAQAKK